MCTYIRTQIQRRTRSGAPVWIFHFNQISTPRQAFTIARTHRAEYIVHIHDYTHQIPASHTPHRTQPDSRIAGEHGDIEILPDRTR